MHYFLNTDLSLRFFAQLNKCVIYYILPRDLAPSPNKDYESFETKNSMRNYCKVQYVQCPVYFNNVKKGG